MGETQRQGLELALSHQHDRLSLWAGYSLIEATYDRDRQKPLTAANLNIEKLRHLFRLAFSLQCLDERRYEYAARQLDEIGRMIGGWKKQAAAHDARQQDRDT